MQDPVHFLLDVWRETCRHIEIGESVAQTAPMLARQLPLAGVLVRRLDPPRCCVETVAQTDLLPRGHPPRGRSDCRAQDMEAILAWCRQGRIARVADAGEPDPTTHHSPLTTHHLHGIVPSAFSEDVLAGPLNSEHGPLGVLLLVALPGQHFDENHRQLVQSLLEPFTVALENDQRVRELRALREAVEADNRSLLSRLGRHDISESIVGAEAGLRPVMRQVKLVAGSDVPVLILGETGSGKEVVARAIHAQSRRATGPFLRVNCGAIPADLIDSELFGHERGSFTGAVQQRTGWFERADRGTLFLDECGELPLAAQVRLLRILQDGSFERVGGEHSLQVDVRIVAATHRDLQAMVSERRFREDLWYRLAVFPIQLPPLRERREDIAALAAHFALRASKRLGMPPLVPTPDDLQLLVAYPWPGNVRELAAVIERAAILGDGKHLDVAKALGTVPPRPGPPVLPPAQPSSVPGAGPLLSLDAAMAHHIEAALLRTRGRIEGPDGAAVLLGINPHTLRARMRKLGLNWQRYRPPARRAA